MHKDNFVAIWWPKMELEQNAISIECKLRWKNRIVAVGLVFIYMDFLFKGYRCYKIHLFWCMIRYWLIKYYLEHCCLLYSVGKMSQRFRSRLAINLLIFFLLNCYVIVKNLNYMYFDTIHIQHRRPGNWSSSCWPSPLLSMPAFERHILPAYQVYVQ